MFANTATPTHAFTTEELEKMFVDSINPFDTVWQQKRPYASQGGFCGRMAMLNGTLPEREERKMSSLKYYAAMGNAIEDVALANYESAGNLVAAQYHMPESLFEGLFNVGGKIDAILTDGSGRLAVIDIKTVGVVKKQAFAKLNDEDIQTLAQGGQIILEEGSDRITIPAVKAMSPSHAAQVQMYCAITGLDDGWLQYLSRKVNEVYDPVNDTPTTAFKAVPISDKVLTTRIAILMYGIRCRDADLIPDKPSGIKKTHCGNAFCHFVDYCWGGDIMDLETDYDLGLSVIDDDTAAKWKADCMTVAADYISRRGERANWMRETLDVPRI